MDSLIPKFSLVIPTLRRPDTLRHSLATLTAQTYDDFEIVVQNNGRDPEVERVVAEAAHPKIRLFGTDAVLPMTQNWETALANTRGEFVTFIGDDDGLFPDACAIAAKVFVQAPIEILSWLPYTYYWPGHVNAASANRLIAHVSDDFRLEMIDADHQIRQLYRFALDYSRLPLIYNSFVRRSVLDRARQTNGRYFFGFSPDVVSAIVNACHVDVYGRLTQPLSMTGASRHSTGHNLWASKDRVKSTERYRRDFEAPPDDPRLVEANHWMYLFASDMLLAHDRMLIHRNVDIDFAGLAASWAASLNAVPQFYESNLAAIRAFAALHHIDIDTIAIHPPATRPSPLECGEFSSATGAYDAVVDGDAAGLANIADAVRYATDRFGRPAAGRPIEIIAATADIPVIAENRDALQFSKGGNGVAALLAGWGEPEFWGAWSVAKLATLRLRTDPGRDRPLDLQLHIRPFLHALHPKMNVVCHIAGKEVASWSAVLDAPLEPLLVRAPVEAFGVDGFVDIDFLIDEPCSPSQLGLGSDMRLLGVAIERLLVVGDPERPSARDLPLVHEGSEVLRFGASDAGAPALRSGWWQAEDWGVWSSEKPARLALRTKPGRERSLFLLLDLNPFLHASHPEANLTCRVGGKEAGAWSASLGRPVRPLFVEIPAAEIDREGVFEMEFLTQNPCSPRQVGLGDDGRLLGVGLRSLCAAS